MQDGILKVHVKLSVLTFGERLSEKGYEQRSDGRFGRYTEGDAEQQVPLWWPQGYAVGAYEAFGQFQ